MRWIGLRVGLERAEPRTGEDCRAGPLQLGRGQLITSSCRFRRPANGAGLGRWAAAMPALLLALSGGGSGPKGAHAAEAPARVAARLIWDGAVCGSADDFTARVRQRTNAVRFVRRGQRLVVRARIERRGDGLAASASIEARGRAPIVRHLDSPDCDDALDALALVVAIGVEGSPALRAAPRVRRRAPRSEPPEEPAEPPPPEASPAPAEAPPEAAPLAAPDAPAPPVEAPLVEPSGESSPAVSSSAAPLPAVSPAAVTPEPAPAAPPAPELDAASASAPSELDVGVGLAGAIAIGVAPRPMIGGGLWVAVEWVRASLWSPELVVSVQHRRLDGLTHREGRADFALTTAGLALCPIGVDAGVFTLRPCASASAGRLWGEGYDTFDPRSAARPWWALGATLEGLARLGVIELRATFGATAPLARDSFSFGEPCAEASACPADVFHHVAPVIWSGALGAGVRIW